MFCSTRWTFSILYRIDLTEAPPIGRIEIVKDPELSVSSTGSTSLKPLAVRLIRKRTRPFSILYRIDLTEAPRPVAARAGSLVTFQYPLPDRPH